MAVSFQCMTKFTTIKKKKKKDSFSTVGPRGSIPCRGTKILHAIGCDLGGKKRQVLFRKTSKITHALPLLHPVFPAPLPPPLFFFLSQSPCFSGPAWESWCGFHTYLGCMTGKKRVTCWWITSSNGETLYLVLIGSTWDFIQWSLYFYQL